MMTTRPETPEDPRIIEFLEQTFADLEAQFIELRIFPARGSPWSSFHSTPQALFDECRRQLKTASPPEFFFGVCPRYIRSGKKDAVKAVTCLWSDLDPKGFSGGKSEMLLRLRTFPLVPTAIVDSGNGLHAYWRLKEIERITDPDDIRRIESCLRGIAQATGGDRSVAELARIMRVPGTLNLKDRQNPKPVKIVELNPDRQYNLTDFDDWIDLAPVAKTFPRQQKSGDSIAHLLDGLEEGNRNDSFARVIGRLHRDGHDPESIFTILKLFAERCQFDPGELYREIDGIARRYPSNGKGGRKQSKDETHRRPNIVCLEDVEPEEIRWLWEPYIPLGKLTNLDGDPGVGKTTLSIQIAASVSNGFALPDATGKLVGTSEPGNVLFLIREDGLGDTMRPRLEKAGATLSKVFAVEGWIDPDSTDHKYGSITLQDLPILRSALSDIRPKIVFIDPIQSFLGAGVDLHRANETRPILDEIGVLAREFTCAIVCVRHLSKSPRDRAIYRALGSIDLSAAARSVLIVGEDKDRPNRRIMAHAKSNLAAKGISQVFDLIDGSFLWARISSLSAEALLASPVNDEERSAVDEAAEFIRAFLADGPRLFDEVKKAAKKAGIAEASLKRAKERAGVDSVHIGRVGGKRGEGEWKWKLRSDSSAQKHEDDHLES